MGGTLCTPRHSLCAQQGPTWIPSELQSGGAQRLQFPPHPRELGWVRHGSKGSDGDGNVASSPGDNISRLKFSACPWYRARLRRGKGVSLLACSMPGLSILEREQTQRARSLHLPNSQRRPKNPGGHWQMVTFPSRQLPPLRHSQSSESSAREETGASQDPSCLQGWDSQAALLDATHRGSSGGWQPPAPPDTQAQPPSTGWTRYSVQEL